MEKPVIREEIMSGEVKQKVGGAYNISQQWKQQTYSKNSDFAVPTVGLEKVTFYYGPSMNPGEF